MSAIKHKAEKAYLNESFLTSPEARLLRILSEYMEPRARLAKEGVKDTIVFFGSARIKSLEEASAEKLKVENSSELIDRAGSSSDEIKKEIEAARKRTATQEKLAHYYEDAVELARLLTEWSMRVALHDAELEHLKSHGAAEHIPFVSLEDVQHLSFKQRYVISSGGGPGIMEAANKGAMLAGGRTIGLNIALPYEQMPNSYISDELNFEFHYFFMRKFWFAYLSKALVVFPGGFGTMDELFECLTLVQTGKIKKKMPIVVYGSDYWKTLLNFDLLAEMGMIDQSDLDLLHFSDTPQEAFTYLKTELKRLDDGEETFMESNVRL